MVLHSWIFSSHVIVSFLLLISCGMTYGTETDIYCLKSIKESLEDPYNYLKFSWDFNNKTEGFICRFYGVECWHPDENRVLNLKLSNMGLKGQFPRSIKNCSTLTGLDFSINKLSGSIPGDISTLIPFVTSLDLSSNDFSGAIPVSLANCTFLNDLRLDQNRLTGPIPAQFGLLTRIKTFNVSNNLLTGQVPIFNNRNIKVKYDNNQALCGGPLVPCQTKSPKSNMAVIASAGGVTLGTFGLGIVLLCLRVNFKKEEDTKGNKWTRSLERN